MQISPFELESPNNNANDSFNTQQILEEELEKRNQERKALQFADYYFNAKKEFERHLGESTIIVRDNLKKIVNNGINIIVEKFIQSQMGTHSSSRSLQLIHKSFQCDFQREDLNTKAQINQLIEEDTEPNSLKIDTWVRGQISVHQKLINEEQMDVVQIHDFEKSVRNDLQKSYISQASSTWKVQLANKQQDKNKPLKQEQSAPPIDLSEPVFMDKQEEYIRAEKEKQVKQQQEQAMQDRKKKREEQEKIKYYQKIVQDSKRKQITYDYDGQIIFVNEVKGEKLPPPAHSMSYQITELQKEPENKQQQSRYKPQPQQKANIPLQKQQQIVYRGLPEHKLPKESQQGIKGGQCFDEFALAKGVTLKFEGKVSSNAISIDQQFKSINLNDHNLKLTKQQYLSLTAEGNLNRKASQTQTLDKRTFSPGDYENQEPKDNNNKIGELAPVLENKKNQAIKRNQFRVRQKEEGIKILAKTAYNTMRLSVDENEEHSFERQLQQQKQSETDRIPAKKFTSPIDEFNHNLMTSKDWGKPSHTHNTLSSLPPLRANFSKTRVIFPRLENTKLKKRTRDRYTKEEMKKGMNLQYLPPPRVGQIVGHELSIEFEKESENWE